MVSRSEFNLRSPSSSSSRCNYRPRRPPSAEGETLQMFQSTVRAFSQSCTTVGNTTAQVQDKEVSVLSADSEEVFYSLRAGRRQKM